MPLTSPFRRPRVAAIVPLLATVLMAWCGGDATQAAPPQTSQPPTLKAVQDRGVLVCGVNPGLLGFASQDGRGAWIGFDVDFCRAVAAAVLGDPQKVRFVPVDANTRFTALQSGAIDLLSRNSTWTLSREAELKLQFAAITYFDGQGFLSRGERGILTVERLAGSHVCVQSGTTHDVYATDYFEARDMAIEVVSVSGPGALIKAYEGNWCDAITSDVSQLYALRRLMAAPTQQMIADVIISKEPLGPLVRQGDDQWLLIVRWTHLAMVAAETLGISAATLDAATTSQVPAVQDLLSDRDTFQALGLAPGAVVRIVRGVGNYGEVFERNLGNSSKLGIPRGLNRLARDGGLQFAPPIR